VPLIKQKNKKRSKQKTPADVYWKALADFIWGVE
jgi:hypothetical protein